MYDPEGTSHFKVILKDFLWGTFAGVFMTLSGHPFDSTKVRMQTTTPHVSMTKWMLKMLKNEGIFSFYKGLTPPLMTIPLVNAVLMASYEFCKRLLGVVSEEEFTFCQALVWGMFAGIVNSFVISPVELVKWRLQIQTESSKNAYYKGSLDWALKIIQEEGIHVLLTSGLISTIARESIGYAGQFGGYYLAKRAWAKLQDCSVNDLGYTSLFVSGGIGGLVWWLLSYPQDIIKTKLQTQPAKTIKYPPHSWIPDEGIISWAKEIWTSEGFHGFWKGFSACSLRAFWGDAFMFLTYEIAINKIDDYID